MNESNLRPLVERVYKVKNAKDSFLCPLCGTKRFFKYSSHLSKFNYLQIIFTSTFLILLAYPLMELKSLFIFFVVWGCFEAGVKIYHRKEIPCPHCGFDMTWYKKDVRVARQMVDDFWARQSESKDLDSEQNINGAQQSNKDEINSSYIQ